VNNIWQDDTFRNISESVSETGKINQGISPIASKICRIAVGKVEGTSCVEALESA
jgi:hypothetical protein